MRWTAFLFLFVTMLGCTTQSSGQRCQQNSDCNADTERCRRELTPQDDCRGDSCICCPTDPTAAAAIAACIRRSVSPEAGVNDSGAPVDTGPAVCTSSMECMISQYCAAATCGAMGTCVPRPTACPGELEPTCGCNGVTYVSPCAARREGIGVSAPGTCPFDGGAPADAATDAATMTDVATDTGADTDSGAATDSGPSAD